MARSIYRAFTTQQFCIFFYIADIFLSITRKELKVALLGD